MAEDGDALLIHAAAGKAVEIDHERHHQLSPLLYTLRGVEVVTIFLDDSLCPLLKLYDYGIELTPRVAVITKVFMVAVVRVSKPVVGPHPCAVLPFEMFPFKLIDDSAIHSLPVRHCATQIVSDGHLQRISALRMSGNDEVDGGDHADEEI